MTNVRYLTNLAEVFCARAITAQQAQSTQFIDTMLSKMAGLAAGAVASVKHLLSMPKYKSSSTLISALDSFQQIQQLLSTVDHADPSFDLDKLSRVLKEISFYSASGNVGTGHDPVMDVQEGGYTAPAYYVDQLSKLLDIIKGHMFKESRF
jgi:hypothetical protein